MTRFGCTRFKDRVALVTGAASGIGRATAERLAEEGASVVLTDRDYTDAEAVRFGLPGAERHAAILHDVTNEANWLEVLETVRAHYGRLDVLVNNAGWSSFTQIADSSLETWRAILAVHLDAAFLGLKHALPLLVGSGRGAVVNVSSM